MLVVSVRAGGIDAGGVHAGGISLCWRRLCWWRLFVLWHSFVLVFMLLLSLQLTYHKTLVSNQILCT